MTNPTPVLSKPVRERKLTHINWFYKDEITDENEWYPLPTIMLTKHNYAGAKMMVYYIHLVWLRWVRNIELCFKNSNL